MLTPRSLMFVIAAIGVLYVIVPVAMDVYFRFRGRRVVACPETGLAEEITLDAWHAAATAVPGPPSAIIASCTRWPERAGCHQGCLGSPSMR